jgi:hypothetical protein
MKPFAMLAVLAAIPACFATSYGRRLDSAAAAKVRTCETKKAEALQILGDPYKTGSTSDLDTLIYEYGGVDGTDRLVVAMDRSGLVVDVAHNAEFSYQPQNRCLAKSARR